MKFTQPLLWAAAVGTLLLAGPASRAGENDVSQSTAFLQTNLTANTPGVALVTDPKLQDPVGAASIPTGPIWTAGNKNGLATLHDAAGNANGRLVVTIPPAANAQTAAPTGVVYNPTLDLFPLPDTHLPVLSEMFIFDGEDGTITAWNPEDPATGQLKAALIIDNSASGAVYKGLAYGNGFIFATNFRSGKIEAYDQHFQPATLDGSFADPEMPANFAPFGIANVDGDLFVTYALQDAAKHDPVVGDGLGFVDMFSTSGVFIRRFASGGVLNAPWGVTRASLGFGKFGGSVLIGNFGNNGRFGGRINAFGNGGEFLGELDDAKSQPISIDGLWSLFFGTFVASDFEDTEPKEDGDTLYFTAGPNNQLDGLFGMITAVRPAGTMAQQ
jgi:uncharacterized protein (TIGR03118 family)